MSVSALTNSFYNYVPVTSSQYDTSSTNNASNSQNQENVKAVDEKNIQTQIISSIYKENSKNTSSNNSNDNNSSSYLTGEEILASRPDKSTNSDKQLTEEEQKQIEELKSRDREVKNHEQAHITAGGSYVLGGATYDYQTGPDGKQYAVGGSVNIDTSPVDGDPEATIAKAQVVIKAALAPAEPSGQDQKVASAARQMMNEARKELTNQNNAEINADTNTDTENKTGTVSESENNTENTANSNTTVNTDSRTSSANTNISSKESADKANNTDNASNTAATQAPVQNMRESNVTSIQQKNNQNITAASYNIGSLISLTA